MTTPASTDTAGSSTRPYLIRALHDWCTDNGFTPYIAVHVDAAVRVPMEYVKENEIVLNVGFEATSGLKLGNEWIEFKARFSGGPREIFVPVDHVIAIYARENGQGMAFPMPADATGQPGSSAGSTAGSTSTAAAPAAGPRRTGPSAVPATTPSPVRGLRLASTESDASGEHERVDADIADTSVDAGSSGSSAGPDEEPPTPPTPQPPSTGAGRPSLKRVK